MPYLSDASKKALSDAVVAIEQASSVELVIALRPACVPALLPAALGGGLGALLGLAFLLFSPTPFSHEAILLDTALCWIVSALCSVRFVALRRWLTPRAVAERAVLGLAAREFVARGIAETRGRTGVLICVAQVEHVVDVLTDLGVRRAVPKAALDTALREIARVVRAREDGVALANAIRELAPLFAAALPRAADDINELEDALCE